jgi:hypothetical protein
MTNPDEYYAVNTIPPITYALGLYLKTGAPLRKKGVIELIVPAGEHKELMSKKGSHDILIWLSKKKVHVRAKCQYDKNCKFNSDRIDGTDREALKTLSWDEANSRIFFQSIRKWLIKLDLDFVTFVRALNTVCNHYVEIPLTSQFGKTFENFDAYRKINWPKEATPDNREKFLEELLVRVAFWFQSAAIVGALKK